ncbi:hypothetical protein JL854_18380, partial [Acinetobacter baumannii]|nr:hypothetical protein [Acinetobacter baumannii]MCD0370295.1 hypothetical protein [Acinetobacter baumannii]
MLNKSKLFLALITLGASKILLAAEGPVTTLNTIVLTAQSDELGSELLGALLHKDLKVKTSHIYSNLSDNSGMW